MRIRGLFFFVAVAAFLRSFVACSHDVGPGDYCQDGWMANYTCPPGYSCNDMKGWTCTANSTYPYPYPTSSAPQPSGRPDAAGRPKYEPDIDADVTAGDDDVDASYASDAGAD